MRFFLSFRSLDSSKLSFGPLNVDNLEVKLLFPELIDSVHTENVITEKIALTATGKIIGRSLSMGSSATVIESPIGGSLCSNREPAAPVAKKTEGIPSPNPGREETRAFQENTTQVASCSGRFTLILRRWRAAAQHLIGTREELILPNETQ
jgi:hypothetical protein